MSHAILVDLDIFAVFLWNIRRTLQSWSSVAYRCVIGFPTYSISVKDMWKANQTIHTSLYARSIYLSVVEPRADLAEFDWYRGLSTAAFRQASLRQFLQHSPDIVYLVVHDWNKSCRLTIPFEYTLQLSICTISSENCQHMSFRITAFFEEWSWLSWPYI